MTDLITEIWAGLKDAGMPDVMLYLADGSASRCHWNETALIGNVRVALLADQDRKIVRIMPVHECTGIGVASPKGTDPAGYRAVVQAKLREQFECQSGRQSTESQGIVSPVLAADYSGCADENGHAPHAGD
jgi:hypothetical protein